MKGALLAALLRYARWLSALAVLGWLAWVALALVGGRPFRPGWIVTLVLLLVVTALLRAWVASRRRTAIRESWLPVLVKRKLRQRYPQLQAKDADLVERGFRQFFLACARSEGRLVAMPSTVVDAYWHAFILDTKAYAEWCERTLGRFLHHHPVERLGGAASRNDGLRRAWFFACRDEAINPRRPTRLPLLFALDAKLGIEGGIVYSAQPRPKLATPAERSDRDLSYVDDFIDDSFAGDADGLGGADSGGDGGGDGGGGDGGDGGGCGGGD